MLWCWFMLTMSPPKSQEHARLALEIRRNGSLVPVPCNFCFEKSRECFAMPEVDGKQLKCSECTRRGKPCVNLSWLSLDKTREEYQKKVDEDEKELARVLARLMRNKAILRQANERATKKMQCLAEGLRDEGEAVDAEASDCPAADALVGFSPALWSTMNMVDNFTDFSALPSAEMAGPSP
jgi:hypothetical protein